MLAAFLRMRKAAAHDDVPLLALSCYRPPIANATSSNHFAVATNSSHGYGLAVDLQLSVDAAHTSDRKAFRVSEVNTRDAGNLMKYYQSSVMKWMAQNGQKFNFHPYFNEPWHFEYNPEGMASKLVAGAQGFKAGQKTS
jgi:LAS superfamily LD-carboxypeptidase LdcB